MRRYIGLEILAKSRLSVIENAGPEEVAARAVLAPLDAPSVGANEGV
jgi:hypothetical protein